VLNLPGIGRYTAGAILSIAFDAREPILEANTIRLFARLLGYSGNVHLQQGQALLWEFAEQLLPRVDIGLFNQALMELGSLVCAPATPACEDCPVAGLCQANRQNLQASIPAAKRKIKFEHIHEAAVVVRRRGRILLRQCEPGQRWAGLWDFPRVPIEIANKNNIAQALVQKVHKQTGMRIKSCKQLTTMKHGVTRYRITLDCFHAQLDSPALQSPTLRWVTPTELSDFPLSTTGRRLAKLIIEP
ncbi:MAG: NUDIX domain-containing protein, partial [Planctomycetales bacterium]